MNTVKLFGCEVASMTMNETLSEIDNRISNKIKTQHVVLNAGKVVLMNKDKELFEIIKNCPIINADGQSIVWASKFLGNKLPERVAGIDLMEEILNLSDKKGYSVYFFGAKEEVVTKVISNYKNKYENLKIAGYRNGYFTKDDMPEIIRDMKESKADILLVGFSSPQKEFWLDENIDEINIPFCMGVGGSFDVVAGKTVRAPRWMQKAGLEWFYRFLQEPGRMWKRYLVGNSKFIYLMLREKFKKEL